MVDHCKVMIIRSMGSKAHINLIAFTEIACLQIFGVRI